MKKRLISLLLVLVTVLGMLPTISFAASSVEEALGEVDIYSGGQELSYLSINGKVQKQLYTYYNYVSPTHGTKEIPAYCVNPNLYGVPQTVEPGQSIKYLANERASDPKVMGIMASGYPTEPLETLKVQDKYEAYYATKMALWCYLISGWNINNLKVNPNCGDTAAAQRVLAAAKWIYSRGTAWSSIASPGVTATPDQDTAYPVTIDGKEYKQQIFTVHSETWPCGLFVWVNFSDPASVPAGTKIVDMSNQETDKVTMEGTSVGYDGQFKILYPAESIEGETGSVQLSFAVDVYQYAVFYAVCAEKDKYGNLQNYMCDTDPTIHMEVAAYSNYTDDPTPDSGTEPDPETGLKIIKLEVGTEKPLSGARFEVINPEGATLGTFATNNRGEIKVPLTLCGNYTVIERDPPPFHLLSSEPTQNVNVEYGKVATVTFYNEAYGALRVEKYSDTGDKLPGAVIRIKHIESGQVYTQTTGASGVAFFDKIKPGAYEIVETAAPVGWQKDDTTYNTNVVAGDTAVFPLVNKELPGLRIVKYDRKQMVTMPGVTFAVYKDGEFLGNYPTDAMGEILLTNLEPGTYRAFEVDTGNDGLILDTTPQEIELKAGDGIRELIFFNDTKPGMKLVKVDSADLSKPIANAKFSIRAVDGSYGPEEFTTDQNGEIDLSKLPVGAYEVVELECPGYVIDEAQRIIHLDPNEDAQFVFTNSEKPKVLLIKTSSDGTPLAGVSFRLAKIEDGSRYLDRTTDANGEILWEGLDPGVYSLKETATVDDHILDLREYHVELFPGKTSTVTIENQRRPNLIVYKNDADTGEPVPNTVFLVKAADGHSVDEIKTDSTGKAELFNLLPGVYEVSEKSVPAPWLNDADPQLVTLYANRDHTVYFKNHKKPTLTVNKVDSITGSPIKGAKFEVWYGNNNTTTGELNSLGTFFSDENGQFTLDLLRDGWYKVTELEPAAGYTIKEPVTQEFYVKGGESKTITFLV